ncbi:RsfA family transcriptional regulator [Alkalibacillus silvisoli]|uniref:Prespore-specific transcription regulator RsfA n=1 Tax=Alkalibacillus silvisoli TaxID=392823 RepID=A0ABN0ZRZ5_9BACI
MVKVRQDAWSHEDDLLLAETVLRHIREGSTQLNAFEEVGDQLNRTAAACGFRWNAEVRKNYDKAVDLAKRQRKQRKKAQQQERHSQPLPRPKAQPTVQQEQNLPMAVDPTTEEDINMPSIDSIIQQLQQFKTVNQANNQMNSELEALRLENQEMKSENSQLKEKVEEMSLQYANLQEDYQTFIGIMDRARKMMVFDEDDVSAPSFKMEKNGNLQQIAK